jgi:polar amino acid transport system substrate-binding protein
MCGGPVTALTLASRVLGMTTRNLFKTLALAAALGLALTACGSSSDDSKDKAGSSASDLNLIKTGTLTVCSDVPYAPFEDFDKSSDVGFKGFDVDIVTAIAKELKVKLVYKDSDFNALQSGLATNSGQCDISASAMTITDERAKKIGFSDPYYDSKQSLLVPAGSDITGIADLDGKKLGVQRDTTGATYAEENAKGARIVAYKDDGAEFTALKAGVVDALLQDLPVNLEHTTDGKYKVVETYDTDEHYGLAMKKSNTALIDKVNDILAQMKSDGSYQKIYDTYFKTS